MNANDVADVINNLVDDKLYAQTARTYRRGVIASVSGQKADVYVDGNNVPTQGILSISSYQPKVGDTVLILSIGDSGINRIILGQIGVNNNAQWTAVTTYQGGWVGFGDSTYAGVFYRKSPSGIVMFKGLTMKGSTSNGTIIFTMPAGFRPGIRSIFLCPSPDIEKPATIDVLPTGEVVVRNVPNNDWLAMTQVQYLAEL